MISVLEEKPFFFAFLREVKSPSRTISGAKRKEGRHPFQQHRSSKGNLPPLTFYSPSELLLLVSFSSLFRPTSSSRPSGTHFCRLLLPLAASFVLLLLPSSLRSSLFLYLTLWASPTFLLSLVPCESGLFRRPPLPLPRLCGLLHRTEGGETEEDGLLLQAQRERPTSAPPSFLPSFFLPAAPLPSSPPYSGPFKLRPSSRIGPSISKGHCNHEVKKEIAFHLCKYIIFFCFQKLRKASNVLRPMTRLKNMVHTSFP